MAWTFELTEDAERDLRRLPKSIQKRFARTLNLMAADPFDLNVKALKGDEWRGVFRRRIGGYRILFHCRSGEAEGLRAPHPASFRKDLSMRTGFPC